MWRWVATRIAVARKLSGSGIKAVGIEETAEGLNNLARLVGEIGGADKDLSERSLVIAAVHRPWVDLEEFVDEDEVIEAYVSELADLRISELTSSKAERHKRAIRRKLQRTTDKILVATIDARDLIDTGEFREDVKTAPWIERPSKE